MGLGLDIVYSVAGVLTSPWWGWRLLRTGKWRTDWRGRFGHVPPAAPQQTRDAAPRTLLIHAVSVGEVNAIRALVQALENDSATPWQIAVSATTDTGFARAQQLFSPRHHVVRYPLDFTPSVRRFLNAVRPDLVALAELEVWPNFVRQCEQRGIPVCVINGRLSARSFKRYRLIAPLLRPTFARLAAAGVQNQEYAERFIELGVQRDRVHVLDTMKWDTAQVVPEEQDAVQAVSGAEALAQALGIDRQRPLIVAGSTGPGEEELLISTCPQETQLLLAPRKPERFDEAAGLAPGCVRRTEHLDGTARPVDGARLFLLDTIGDLRKAYALADVCIVGRSFLGLYGSDVMEPVGLGKPTIIGPCHSDFQDTVDALRQRGGIEVTDRPGELAAVLLHDAARARRLADAGRRVILSRQGATRRHVDMLRKLIPCLLTPDS